MGIVPLNPVNTSQSEPFLNPMTVCFLTKPPLNTGEISKYADSKFLKCQTLIRNFSISEKTIKVEKVLENLSWKQFTLAVGDGSSGGSQFIIQFLENESAIVTNTFMLIYDYMKSVVEGSGKYKPAQESIDRNIIDYSMSLYFLVLKPNAQELLAYGKVCNLILTGVAGDIFSYDRVNIDVKMPSINFASDTTILNKEYVLEELGELLGANGELFYKGFGSNGIILSDEFTAEIMRYQGSAEENFYLEYGDSFPIDPSYFPSNSFGFSGGLGMSLINGHLMGGAIGALKKTIADTINIDVGSSFMKGYGSF